MKRSYWYTALLISMCINLSVVFAVGWYYYHYHVPAPAPYSYPIELSLTDSSVPVNNMPINTPSATAADFADNTTTRHNYSTSTGENEYSGGLSQANSATARPSYGNPGGEAGDGGTSLGGIANDGRGTADNAAMSGAAGTRAIQASAPAVTGFNPPRPIKRVEPIYPERARWQGLSGTVRVRLLVTADGSVADCQITDSSGISDIDNAVIDALREWRFMPATDKRTGAPVDAYVSFTVVFKINN